MTQIEFGDEQKLERNVTPSDNDCDDTNVEPTEQISKGAEVIMSDLQFKPIYSIGAWQEPDENDNRYVSVAILMFTGQDKTTSFSVNVVDGEYLEYSIAWPRPLCDTNLLHRKWISGEGRNTRKLEYYHPMIRCFLPFISRIRGNREKMVTTARIPLPFPVETNVDQHLLKFPNTSARILYCMMRAPANKKRDTEEEDLVFE